ncbi:MAG: translocation/assembly module TamB domain-containing protein [Rhodobacteraceae bacterium]|nr:translocation/assembly module TamB domain-containing protein [Paracoccaceae bacterium]
MKRLLLLLCLCLPLAAFADTEEDKGRLTRFLQDSLSGAGRTVTIDGFTGALSSVANVEKISIADAKGVWLRLETVALDWNRAALLKGRLEVNTLSAKTITLTRQPASDPAAPTPEATPFSLPDLPVSVDIGAIKADKITIGKDVFGSPLTAKLAGQLSLSGGQGRANIALNRTDDIAGAFLLRAGFDNVTRQLTVDLSATEARDGLVATLLNIPDRPSIALTVSGDAPLSAFDADLSLATDGTERIKGRLTTTTQEETETVSAQQSLSFDLNGDLSPLVEARFRPFFGDQTSLSATARKDDDGRVHLENLALATAAMRLSGKAVVAPTNLPESFALDVALGPTDATTLLLPASLDLSLASATLKARYDASESDAWTLEGKIAQFAHPDVTAQTIALTGGGRIRPETPRQFDGDIRLLASGLRATDPARPDVARALGPEATVDLGLNWTEGAPVDITRLALTTQTGTINAKARIDGPPLAPVISTNATARLADLAVLAPFAGRPLRGSLDATLDGTIKPLAGMFDLELEAKSTALRTGTKEIDALTSDGLSRLETTLRRTETGLTWENANLTTPALTASSNGSLQSGGGTIALEASIDTLARLVPSINGAAKLSARATGSNNHWQLDLDANGPGGAQLATQGTLAQDLSTADLTAEGNAPLALVNGLTESVRVTGPARFNLGLRGPLALSSLSGTVEISDARLSVASPQLALENIGSTIRIADGGATLSTNGRFALGGTFSVDGRTGLTAPFNADLTAQFQNAHIRYEHLLETVLLGDIRINGPLTGDALISGDLQLESTEVRVDSVSASSAPLPDITHVNSSAKVNQTRLYAGAVKTGRAQSGPAYRLDLGISAPSRIFLRGRGLDAEFGGAVRLRGDTSNVITSGGFDLVRGRMSFLAKRFELTEGAIRMQGGLIPHLRLIATTQSNAASFDLTLEGQADAPAFSITSDPDMPEDEALAQLLFGESLADISPLQAARLAAAVATLTGSGSGFNPLGSLREGAGIDDLDLKTDAEGNTSVTAGKYISDNIYTEVEVGGSGESAISLNLDVSPNLTVKGQADSEANSGLGLFFQKDY